MPSCLLYRISQTSAESGQVIQRSVGWGTRKHSTVPCYGVLCVANGSDKYRKKTYTLVCVNRQGNWRELNQRKRFIK
jgi:hypothetical protein